MSRFTRILNDLTGQRSDQRHALRRSLFDVRRRINCPLRKDWEELESRDVPTLLGQQLFPADYPWNQNIANAPVAANSAAVISHIGGSIGIHPDWGEDSAANGTDPLYGIPFNVVHGNSVAKVNVIIDNYPSESDVQAVPIPANTVIEGDLQNGPNLTGAGYNTGQRGDSHLIIWDEDNNIAYELYGVTRPTDPTLFPDVNTGNENPHTDGKWHAAQETVWDMKTDSFRSIGYTSADAAGLSILAGLVRPDEGLPVASGGQGVINHALRFTLPSGDVNPQYVYPASHQVSTSQSSTKLPFGARLRLASTNAVNTKINAMNPEAQIIAHAMQQYGLVLADIGSAMYVSGASGSVNASNALSLTWNMTDVLGLNALKASDFQVVSLTPVVSGVSANSGAAGSTVTITGQNFSGAAGHLSVFFGSTPATSVTFVSDTQITAVVPAGSGTVHVTVQSGVNNPDTYSSNPNANVNGPIFGYGTSTTSAADQFTYGTGVGVSASSTASFAAPTVAAGSTDTVTLVIKDTSNAPISGLANSAFVLSLSGGTSTGSFGTVTETATPGTYTVTFTAGTAGTVASLTVTVSGVQLTSHPTVTVTGGVAAPTVTGVTSSVANGSYGTGSMIAIQVTFSAVVNVTGTPTLLLNSGGTASYTGGTGTTTLTFTYTVAAGQNSSDLDYASTTALALSGGTIKDALSNNATLTLAAVGTAGSLGNSKNIVIDTTPPTVSIGAPSATITNGTTSITYTITYSDTHFNTSTLAVANITLNKTGTANGTIGVAGSGLTRTVTISGITGDGTLGISLAAGTASDTAGNLAPAAGPSTTFKVDTTPPTVAIGAPSATSTTGASITYTITYADTNFSTSTLAAANITLNKTGTANGTIGVSGSGTTRTVTISGITGTGTLGISIAAGTASDTAGNLAPAAGPSTTFSVAIPVDTIPPTVSISAPSATSTTGASVTYTITYADANFNASTLTTANITLNKTGTVNGTVNVDSSTGTTRIVTISGITGTGTLGISIAAGTANDAAGNLAPAAGPSTTFSVAVVPDTIPPTVAISAPSVANTNGATVTYTITYADANFNASTLSVADITLNTTGTATGTLTVDAGIGSTRTVTISNITGNGTLGISLAAGTASDAAGNLAPAAGPSATFNVDTIPPTVAISAPSATSTTGASVTYTITYVDANFNASTLTTANITLNTTGTANGTVTVDNSLGSTRTVTISNITGNGTLGISLAAGTANDLAGNLAPAAGPSATFSVTSTTSPTTTLFAVGGADGFVRLMNNSGTLITAVKPISGYTGLVSVAQGDFNGDGVPDVAVTAAANAGQSGLTTSNAGKVFVYDGAAFAKGTLTLIHTFTPFATHFAPGSTTGAYTNGLNIAVADINGDGHVDLVAGTRGGNGTTAGQIEVGRLVVIDGTSPAGTNTIIGGIQTPFSAGYQKGVVVAAGNVDGIGGDEIAVTRGGPVNSPNPAVQQIKLKVIQLQGTTLTELPLNADSTTSFAPFASLTGAAKAINRDGRVAFVDSNGDGKAELVFSALDPLTNTSNEQVRIGVYAIDPTATKSAATVVSTGADAGTYLTGIAVQDHAISPVGVSGTQQNLALLTQSSASGVVYLAPLTGVVQTGGFSLSIVTGGITIDGI